jgi:putative RNA 2'-phosphotransferase
MADQWTDTEVSKFLSYVLRHNPAAAGIVLDKNGWAPFSAVVAAATKKFGASTPDLLRVIEGNSKKRFTLDGDRIRAAQGHSVDIDLQLSPKAPPPTLFHGTTEAAWRKIQSQGLDKMQRTHVHLSSDEKGAEIVAKRRKGPHALLSVDAAAMASNGHIFYLSENSVWLCDAVPADCITLLMEPVE